MGRPAQACLGVGLLALLLSLINQFSAAELTAQPKIQQELMDALHEASYARALADCPSTQRRLLFLTTRPSCASFFLDKPRGDNTIIVSRLGLPQPNSFLAVPQRCACGVLMDPHGNHTKSCPRSSRLRTDRHDSVQAVVADMYRATGAFHVTTSDTTAVNEQTWTSSRVELRNSTVFPLTLAFRMPVFLMDTLLPRMRLLNAAIWDPHLFRQATLCIPFCLSFHGGFHPLQLLRLSA
jgi:hypothetical protein